MIDKFLDPYDLKARIVPGLILVFPILIDALYAAPILNSWPIFTATGVCGFALVYALGQLASALGERIQSRLWESWGGPPSTRFMRHRDSFFTENLKRLIYKQIPQTLSMPLMTEDEEARDSQQADKEINGAFLRVKDYLRENDSRGLWFTHNVEYGFCRNLLGLRVLWIIVSLAAIAFAVVHGIRTGHTPINPAAVMDCLSLVCAGYIGWTILPGATKRAADQYAESAWLAFLRKAEASQQAQVLSPAAVRGDGHGV
jgi:hypothetical protein